MVILSIMRVKASYRCMTAYFVPSITGGYQDKINGIDPLTSWEYWALFPHLYSFDIGHLAEVEMHSTLLNPS